MLRFLAFLPLLFAPFAYAADGEGDSGWLSTLWAYLDRILSAIDRFVQWCTDVLIEVFSSLLAMLKDLVFWTFEQLFSLVATLISGVSDAFGLAALAAKVAALWAQVPPEIVQVMQAIGIPSALTIVVSGILIRFALQLIPFVRLGS